ncbi:NADH:flavin oxidoreductase [Enterococcus raffinosus]|uniref:NADH:flavin oxidoreductase n=1 Tax=Enterococcus raffinosus TaxID=71452 RepID=A0AAW8TBH3_9ENTE|nr:NADH:flavin oxidoreductase [Enterococcus raffinosus]MDT2524344.1 NADH:flavin oxidoreductase [Enterococcus raffinosus]MDT2530521.1 NADH:flavin oxidoreductase [Enterococcus raffinosus]MDT2535277.1 NADH:flavin oxidoreductase [Enterococcus raffinosus]MDT2545171.1 NADH:flavin oxidoreductase [Enterococcus raffinosus]MDT2578742.1 NADH:flavin oxidoreductase [Enterococcus raffinosus]
MSLLGSPITIGQVKLPNRLVLPPMATAKSQDNGEVTEALCEYYREKSTGGYIGLIITEHSFVSPEGRASSGQLSIAKDEDILGLKKLVKTIHHSGTKVFAQLAHAGGLAKQPLTGLDPKGPSSIVLPKAARSTAIPQEMIYEEIQKVVTDFASAALRAKKVGFDGVELHSAHGYLLNQFYSPLTNKRKDVYRVEDVEGRIRLHLEIIQAVREVVGPDYPIAIRLGASDHMTGGTTIEDSIIAAKEFEKAGICLLDVSGGFSFYTNPYSKEQGYFSELTEALKREIDIPVLLTGGIVDASVAENLLLEEKADMIGVGRAILKDSAWAKRAILSLQE